MHVIFVCTGNICRSPMAERVARHRAAAEGLDVEFTSAGVSDEEWRNPIDPRAQRVLRRAGYDASNHTAHRITDAEVASADLLVALDNGHLSRLRRLYPDADVRLLTSFDPSVPAGTGVVDPWYGDDAGFDDTLEVVESAMPGLFEHLRARGSAGASQR